MYPKLLQNTLLFICLVALCLTTMSSQANPLLYQVFEGITTREDVDQELRFDRIDMGQRGFQTPLDMPFGTSLTDGLHKVGSGFSVTPVAPVTSDEAILSDQTQKENFRQLVGNEEDANLDQGDGPFLDRLRGMITANSALDRPRLRYTFYTLTILLLFGGMMTLRKKPTEVVKPAEIIPETISDPVAVSIGLSDADGEGETTLRYTWMPSNQRQQQPTTAESVETTTIELLPADSDVPIFSSTEEKGQEGKAVFESVKPEPRRVNAEMEDELKLQFVFMDMQMKNGG